MKKLLLAVSLLPIAHAFAGTFHVSEFGDDLGTPVSRLIAGVVTDDFTSTFPAEKYSIVVIYRHFRLGNDNLCDAIAGVTHKKKKGDIAPPVPLWRFSSNIVDRNSGSWNVNATRDCQFQVIRRAVENMMSIPSKELKEKSGL